MKLTPAPNRILLTKPEAKTQTSAGILLVQPELPFAYGTVWAVGEGSKVKLTPGDIVFYEPFSAQELDTTEFGGEVLLMLRDDSVVATIPKQADNSNVKKGK